MKIVEFRFDEIGKVVVTGSMEGYDFTLPVSYDQAQILLDQIKNGGETAINQDNNRKRMARKTKEAREKADKRREDTPGGGGGPSPETLLERTPDKVEDPPKKSAPPPPPIFREPAAAVAMTRKRMSKADLALMARFEKCMPKVPEGKRRSGETMKKLEIARSYILADKPDVILDWIKHLKNGGNLALVANG